MNKDVSGLKVTAHGERREEKNIQPTLKKY